MEQEQEQELDLDLTADIIKGLTRDLTEHVVSVIDGTQILSARDKCAAMTHVATTLLKFLYDSKAMPDDKFKQMVEMAVYS